MIRRSGDDGALGSLSLLVQGSRSARTGSLTASSWRLVPGSAAAELVLVAQFAEKVVTVRVEIDAACARRLGMAT